MTLEHAAVQEALIKATLELMASGGLEAVKARVVAERAGVSVGTVYNLFGNIDDLVLAANLRIYQSLNAFGRARMGVIEARVAEKTDSGAIENSPKDKALERLMGLGEAYVDFVAENASAWSALLAFNRTRNVATNEDNLKHLASLMDIVASVLVEVPIWTTGSERRKAARAMWSAVHGIVVTNFTGVDQADSRARTLDLQRILLATLVEGMFSPVANTAGRLDKLGAAD